jgi:type I site-specific restriction endonuclease
MLRASVLTSILIAFLSLMTYAQPVPVKQDTTPIDHAPQKPGEFGAPTEEMLRRAEIRHEEESHKEMVERSDEAAQIGEEILSSFKKNSSLTTNDFKKLERLEKLARKIRGSAGGSDDEGLQDPPVKIESAVTRLAEISGALKKSVEKSSRLVISASVIKNSNEMIELIRHIRNIKRP